MDFTNIFFNIYTVFILLISLTIFYILKNEENKAIKASLILLVVFTIIMGLRYDVGIDFKNYESYFVGNTYIFSIKEMLWILLNKLIFYFNGSFFWVSLISLIITNIFIYFGIKKRYGICKNFSISIILYICNYAIIFLNIIRQGIAISIIFFAISYLYENKYFKYSLFCILASLFHTSALICLLFPILFINKNLIKKINFKIVLLTIIFAYFLVFINIPSKLLNIFASIIPAYAKYINSIFITVKGGSLLSLGVLSNVLICLILFKYSSSDDSLYIDKFLYFIGVIFNVFSISSFMIDRIGIYFAINSIVAIPKLLENIKPKSINVKSIVLKNTTLFKQSIICITLVFNLVYFSKTVVLSAKTLNLEYKSVIQEMFIN